jgi:formate dehydrogenase major subunit
MELSRRNFLKFSAGTLGAGAIGMLGFDAAPAMARITSLKISQARVTKGICPYCSVSCGVLVYTLTDGALNVKARAVHVEGNPDDPVNRGTLCPKGATIKDFLNAPTRLTKPLYRAPGMAEWKEVTWDWSIDKMAALIKDTRDKAFVEKDDKDRTVNRCDNITAIFGSTLGNEEGYLGVKIARALGLVALETQARI